MIFTNCENNNNGKVKELTDTQEWNDNVKPFSRLLELLKDKRDFTSATINGRDVLLFTWKNDKAPAGGQNGFYLFISDGTRVKKIGLIASEVSDTDPIRLLFTDNELFSLHKKPGSSNDHSSIILMHHEKLLETIKTVIDAWKTTDDFIEKQCTNFISKDTSCDTKLSADGLVGFLSGKVDNANNKWEDEYLNVNANVRTSVIKTNDGFMFSGAGAGAVWLMIKTEGEEEGQPYNLKDSGFTLVAPVKISGNANQTNSILGVGLKGTGGSGNSQRSIGLWCSDKGKWAVGEGETQSTNLVPTSENCEQGETYSVVLVFKKGENKLEVHIDGTKLEITPTKPITNIGETETISYFYFGAGSKQNSVETHVTIKYVLLYNHPLDGNVIQKLKLPKIKRATNPEETDGTNNMPGQQGKNDTKNNEGVNNEESGETEKKQTSTATTTEDSAVRVGFVGVLCFMLFGVFTLLGRYVY